MTALRRTLTIRNDKGLHARASARFVNLVEDHPASVHVSRDGMRVPGDSIMGLLMLAAAKDSEIEVEVEGEGAEGLLERIAELVETRFGEDR